jgi:hypothetical protein
MQIFTFLATDPDSPVKAIARIRCEMTGAKGKAVIDWHPAIFGSVTAESAAQRAQEWWDAELAKASEKEAKRLAKSKKGAPPAPTEKEPVQAAVDVEDPGDVV